MKPKGKKPPKPKATVPAIQLPPAPPTTQPVQVKLVQAERFFLDSLVQSKRFASRSAALRAGLGMLMERWKIDPELDQLIERQRRLHAPRRRFDR